MAQQHLFRWLLAALMIISSIGRMVTNRTTPSGVQSSNSAHICTNPSPKQELNYDKFNLLFGRAKPNINYNMYTGYIEIAPNNYYFYWFFGNRDGNASAPLILYTNGGPGCSSMEAATTENSPLNLVQISESCDAYPSGCDYTSSFSNNPYAWNAHANLLYVDNPRGVGYSYGLGPPTTSTVMAAQDMLSFLLEWYPHYPELVPNKLVIAGESYAGHYLPAWSLAILEHNSAVSSASSPSQSFKINLAGVLIGNGWIDTTLQDDASLARWAQRSNMVPPDWIPPSQASNADDDDASNPDSLHAKMRAYIGYTPNEYDVRQRLITCPGCMGYNYTAWTLFFNRTDVRSALGVCQSTDYPGFAVAAQGCLPSMIAGQTYDKSDKFNYTAAIAQVLASGVQVMLYYGMQDTVCNYVGGEAVVASIPWSEQQTFNSIPYTDFALAGATVGSIRSLAGLSFMLVEGSGHMVPQDQPATSAAIVEYFLAKLGTKPAASRLTPVPASPAQSSPPAVECPQRVLSSLPFGLNTCFAFCSISCVSSVLCLAIIAKGIKTNAYIKIVQYMARTSILFDCTIIARALLELDCMADRFNVAMFFSLFCSFSITLWTNLITTQCLFLALKRVPLDITGRFPSIVGIIYVLALILCGPQLSDSGSVRRDHLATSWVMLALLSLYNFIAILYVRRRVGTLPDSCVQEQVQKSALESLSKRLLYYPLWQSAILSCFPMYFIAQQMHSKVLNDAGSALLVLFLPLSGTGYAAIFLLSQPKALSVLSALSRESKTTWDTQCSLLLNCCSGGMARVCGWSPGLPNLTIRVGKAPPLASLDSSAAGSMRHEEPVSDPIPRPKSAIAGGYNEQPGHLSASSDTQTQAQSLQGNLMNDDALDEDDLIDIIRQTCGWLTIDQIHGSIVPPATPQSAGAGDAHMARNVDL